MSNKNKFKYKSKSIKAKSEVGNLPKMNPFDKTLFYQLSIPDLLCDILLIIFSFFVSDELFSNSGLFIGLKSWQIIAMYCVVVLTLPWYLGYIYGRNSAFYRPEIIKIFRWVFILMTIMVLVYLVRLLFSTGWEDMENMKGIDEFMGAFAIFLLVLGPMMCLGGAASAYQSFSPDGDESKKFNPDKSANTWALLMLVLAIAFMIYFTGAFQEKAGDWIIIVAYLGGPIAAVLVFAAFILFLTLLEKIGLYRYLAIIAQNTFPLFIISVLVFWSGIAIHFMISDFGDAEGKISTSAMIFSVLASGLVPFRIIMLFNAPIRMTNIIIGILSLGYFMVQMILLTK